MTAYAGLRNIAREVPETRFRRAGGFLKRMLPASNRHAHFPFKEKTMQRRDFLRAGIAVVASGALPGGAVPVRRRFVAWAPYQSLDLEAHEMLRDPDIARIIAFAREFIPQSNTGKPAYDPKEPNKRGNERPMPGHGKRIHAAEMSISLPNTYSKAMMIKTGLKRILAADKNREAWEMLMVGLQCHTTSFDHPTDGICVPHGFQWDWVMTVPHAVADAHRRAWTDAGYQWSVTPSVRRAAEQVKARGWPTGWLNAKASTMAARQYSIMPDLRIAACRTFFLDRYAMITGELGVLNVQLGGKSGWLHGKAAVRNRPERPSTADPWLPSPYPDDSYRDANVDLVKEAVARFGPERVTWTNTGKPTREERVAQGLPEYVSLPDGGIRAIHDEWYGSRATNWTLAALVAKGALPAE